MNTASALDFFRTRAINGPVPFAYSGGIGSSGSPEAMVRFLQFWGTIHDPAIERVLLNVSVTNRDPHGAWVRADVQVVYRPERPSDEYVSARDVVVTITQTSSFTRADHKRPEVTVVVTAPADVQRLRAMVNRAPTKPDGPHGCTLLTGREPDYVVAFQRTRTSAPDLVATTQNYCDASTSVTVHGESRPLLEAGDLPTFSATLLAIRAH